MVQFAAADRLRRGGVLFRDAKASAEGGVTMRQRLRRIIRKEFIQALRDPRMRGMLFLPPLIQLLIFGYAANLDVDTAKIAWMDQDRTPESRELLSEFEGSGRFMIAGMPHSDARHAADDGPRAGGRRDPRAAGIRARREARARPPACRFCWTAPIPTPRRSSPATPARPSRAIRAKRCSIGSSA